MNLLSIFLLFQEVYKIYKNIFLFVAYDQIFQKYKKSYRLVFLYKNSKYIFACILRFNNQFTKSMRVWQIFQ
jgi:hypothetical protein